MFCAIIVFGTAAASYLGTVVTVLSAIKSEIPPLPHSQRYFAPQLKTVKFQIICRAKLFSRKVLTNFLASKNVLTILISSVVQFATEHAEFTVRCHLPYV